MAVTVAFSRVVFCVFDVLVRVFARVVVSGCGSRGGKGSGGEYDGYGGGEFFQHVRSPCWCVWCCVDARPLHGEWLSGKSPIIRILSCSRRCIL